MFKFFHQPLLFCALFLTVALAQALPKNITLEYEVTRDGKPFATIKEKFSQGGGRYKIESVTKGIGLYALFGERKLTSEGLVNADGLQPQHFELHQGDNSNKSLINDFNWREQTLQMMVKGKAKTLPLPAGTQDLLSFAYQFMFAPPLKDSLSVTLTTGKKVNVYDYTLAARGAALATANTTYQTVQLTSVDKKQLWLAEATHYLVVRYSQLEDAGAVLEQTLTKMQVD
jgi:hypothetical protein